jgi:branched-subunit amino acid aminotransferase/4-amino-4-deoxychorismate lyase
MELRSARERAERVGGAQVDDCIFLDTAGHVSEATASNVFIHYGDALVTPAAGCGALPGITRKAVLDIAATMGIRTEERVVEPEELRLAGEVFLTSSLRGIASVGTIEGQRTPAPAPGSLTLELQARLSRIVSEYSGDRRSLV